MAWRSYTVHRHAIEQTHRVQCRIDGVDDGVAASRPHEDAIDATPTPK